MIDISWPEGLRGPLVSTFSQSEMPGFIESPLATGPAFVEPISEDVPTIMNLTYQFKTGDARRFGIWLRDNAIRFKSPWFKGPIVHPDFDARKEQLCRYTVSGYPQLSGVTAGGIYTYSAQVIIRQVETQDIEYSEETKAAWEVNCGDVNRFNQDLDCGFNDW